MTPPSPSRIAESILAVLVPPACREEVMGDLHERYRSGGQYYADALRTIPLVILSRIRRTADPRELFMQACAAYASFFAAAWLLERASLEEQYGIFRLMVPAAVFVLGLLLADAYRNPFGKPSLERLVIGPLLGSGLSFVSQGILRLGNSLLAIPNLTLLGGCGITLLLSTALRILFSPVGESFGSMDMLGNWQQEVDRLAATMADGVRVRRSVVAAIAVLLGLLVLYGAWKEG